MVANIGEDMRAKLKRSLKPARRINVTTDIWSSKQYRDSYLGETFIFEAPVFIEKWLWFLGVTGSFACPVDRKLKSLKIGKIPSSLCFFCKKFSSACTPFNESHTGIAIANKMMDVLKSYNIEDKVHHFLTDNAPNMLKGNGFGFY